MLTSTTDNREGNPFERFVASNAGRATRVILGASLLGLGLGVVRGPAGVAMATFGLLALVTGAANLCPIAPLWGGHFLGSGYCRPKR